MWFTASILLKSEHDIDPPLEGFWEESVVLIEASNEQEAANKARVLGKSKEHEYYAEQPSRHRIRWLFECVERVCEVGEQQPGDGDEVFSRFLRRSEAESLLRPFDDSD